MIIERNAITRYAPIYPSKPKRRKPTKLPQYRLPKHNYQITRSHKRDRPNPKHKSQKTKDTCPPPYLSFLIPLTCAIHE